MTRRTLGLALAGLLCAHAGVAGAQVLPLPPYDCPGADFYYPGHGYDPLGYIADGLVVRVHHIFRFSSSWPGVDQDWNFVIRAIDTQSCPDGKSMFGRDCAGERAKFVNIFWGAASDEWRLETTKELLAAKVQAGLPAADVQALLADGSNGARMELGRRMWALTQAEPFKYGRFPADVQAEVQISTDDPDDEAGDGLRQQMISASGLSECDQGQGGLCGMPVLMYGTAVADTGHLDGKPELHPLRALVTGTTNPEATSLPASYRVRVFADYGKAGDGGSGSIAGRVCENWNQNTYWEGNSYLPYVAINPQTFGLPKDTSGGSVVPANVNTQWFDSYTSSCTLKRVMLHTWSGGSKEGLYSFPADSTASTCDWFMADPMYRKGKGRVFGGFGVADLSTDRHRESLGYVKGLVTVSSPVSVGLQAKGALLGGKPVAQDARYYKFTAKAQGEYFPKGGAKTPVPLDGVNWSLPAGAHAASTQGGTLDFYVPIAPVKSSALAGYAVKVSAKGSYQGKPLSPPPASEEIPKPLVEAKATGYTLGPVQTGKPLSYKATFSATGKGFAGAPAFKWFRKGQLAGAAPTVTLTLDDSDGKKTAVRLEGSDGYEAAEVYASTGVPETFFGIDVTRSGTKTQKTLTKFFSKSMGGVPCVGLKAFNFEFFSKVTVQAQMLIAPNPYGAPAPSSPKYTWGGIEISTGKGEWKPYAAFTAQGNTLHVDIPGPMPEDVALLPTFRAKLTAVDDYQRTVTDLVYFANYEDPGDAIDESLSCMDRQFKTVSKIPPWEWRMRDPLREDWNPRLDKGNLYRDVSFLARVRALYGLGAERGVLRAPLSTVTGVRRVTPQALDVQEPELRGVRIDTVVPQASAPVQPNAPRPLSGTLQTPRPTRVPQLTLRDGALRGLELLPSGRPDKSHSGYMEYRRLRRLQDTAPLFLK